MTYDIFDADARGRWLEHTYPLSIIKDRYSGTYSEGVYLAFPLDYQDIPAEVSGSDIDCTDFWWDTNDNDRLVPVGRGETPQAAYEDLLRQMGKEDNGGT